MKYNKKLSVVLLIVLLIAVVYYNSWRKSQFEVILLDSQISISSCNLMIPFQFMSKRESVYKINFYIVDRKNKINFYPEYVIFAKKNKTHILEAHKELDALKTLSKNCKFYLVLEKISPSYRKFIRKVVKKQKDKILEFLKNVNA